MKQWARQSKSAIIAYKILQNWRMRKRFSSGQIETEHGSSHSRKSLAESIAYIEEQFRDYLTYGELTPKQLQGKKILELGFGDNVGVALKFIAAGAEKVVCVDKFYSKRDSNREREIYTSLRDKLSEEEKRRFDTAVEMDEGIKFNSAKLQVLNGLDLEEAAVQLRKEGEAFDIVLSRAVIEEIYEPQRMFAAADQLLAPGGLMLHKIDLSDYGIFSDGGMHPLTFLTIPNPVYRLMATDSGIPNRKLIGYYREQMNALLYKATFLVTGIVGHGPVVPHRDFAELNENGFSAAGAAIAKINEIRPRLCPEYREMSNEELMVQGIFVRARKPLQAN
jgi:SAM-dependent methyltransferase